MAKSYRKEIHGKSPYFDDYDSNKKFVRILSRPGYPLQAREVTQLQTILQDQIERLGSHFFNEGANVKGGEIIESSAIAIRLADSNFTIEELKSFVGKTITNESNVSAKIISYSDSTGLVDDRFQVLFVIYTSSGTFAESDRITIEGTLPVKSAVIGGNEIAPSISVATNVININSGIFFVDGFLLETDSQSFAAYNTSSGFRNYENPTSSIGFKVERDIITSDDDETLKDPSFGFYNFNSPGADRYKINLTLDQISISSGTTFDAEDYIELVRIVGGETTKKVRYTDYAIIEDTLARRTFDESGNYTVRPFQITPVSYSTAFSPVDVTKHAIKIGSGKAYVRGYEYETISPIFLSVDRALDREKRYQEILKTPLKNYVSVLRESSFDDIKSGERNTFTQNKKAIVQRVETDGSVNELGTCNIRTMEEVDGELRLYLFNINMSGSTGFAKSTHIAVSDGNATDNIRRFRIGTSNTDTAIKNVGVSRQIFKAPVGSGLIKGHDGEGLDSTFLVKKPYQVSFIGRGAVITSNHPFLEGTSRNHVLFYADDDTTGGSILNIDEDYTINVLNSGSSNTLLITLKDSIPADGKGTLIASQRWTSDPANATENIRSKTLVESTMGGKTGDPLTGIVNLDHPDVYKILSITDATSTVTDRFELDVNAGVDAYRRSRIILKAGATCGLNEDGDIAVSSITYQRFSHSGSGPFTVDSYPANATFTYEDIPVFNDPETGESYSLADAYDFRPIATDSNESGFNNGSNDSQVVAFENGVVSSVVSYEHFLGRRDKVVLTKNRSMKIVKGIPSVNPVSPTISQDDMALGDLVIKPYTASPTDIRFVYIDNQRTTMSEINEQEKSIQNDQFVSFRSSLQQNALSSATSFRSTRTPIEKAIFVDTFIGHNNAITIKRDHNCSIDPEYGQLRPAFESSFNPMGASGENLPANVEKTTDDVYLLTSDTTIYEQNTLASTTIEANQFSVPDYLGTIKIYPQSDSYFSVIDKPQVIVNSVGELDNWEHYINAYQRGRTRGFGSQWRDWETIWFGSVRLNDNDSIHDASGTNYTRPKRSTYVSRILSEKIIRKIGNKIVDISVVPYMRAKTIRYEAKNLKPNTNHLFYFDGSAIGFGGTTDASGGISGTFSVGSSRYLTGEKLVRISDNTTGNLNLATSSADTVYYAQGLLDTEEGDISSIRPAITRRKASNVEDVSTDRFDANENNNLTRTYNSQTPLAQEIYTDSGRFPNGIMLKNVVLHFASKDENNIPIKVHIRPMFNGSPDPYKVLPFSEVTLTPSEVNIDTADGTNGTTFTFSTPVYLKPRTSYAVCVSTNSSDYRLWTGVEKEKAITGEYGSEEETIFTVTRPQRFGPLHIPQNNGAAYSDTTQYLRMTLNRCDFSTQSVSPELRTAIFTTDSPTTKSYHVAYIHANEQLIEDVRPVNSLVTKNVGGVFAPPTQVELNKTIDYFTEKKVLQDTDSEKSFRLSTTFNFDDSGAVCTMIDGERMGALTVEYMANNDDAAAEIEEINPTSRLATNRSRYISRKVVLDESANDMVVVLDGSFLGNSQVKVYVKTQGPDQPNGNFEDNQWRQLYPEGIFEEGQSVAETFFELKPENADGGRMRFTTQNTNPGLPSFIAYQIKIVLMGENVSNTGNAIQIPIVDSVAAVPLRSTSQDEIRRLIPPGSILAWAAREAPEGFVFCDGSEYNWRQNPEYLPLFLAIGYEFGGDSGNQSFKVPDLRQRTIVGPGELRQVYPVVPSPGVNAGETSDLYFYERNFGETGGKMRRYLDETSVPLVPHVHGFGRGRNNITSRNNDFWMINSYGSQNPGERPGDWRPNLDGDYPAALLPGDDCGDCVQNGAFIRNYQGSSDNTSNPDLTTTWPLRPPSSSTWGGGYGNAHIRRNYNTKQLNSVVMNNPYLVLNYIIKI